MRLLDRLSGESVEAPAGLTAADVVEWRLVEADHPRADFRARPLRYHLLDASENTVEPETVVDGFDELSLVGDEADEIRVKRDRWLADIEARGTATTSVSTSTHLALVERTGSRLDDVVRLRAMVEAQRVAVQPPKPNQLTGARLALLAGLGLVLVVGAGVLWFLNRDVTGESSPFDPPDEVGVAVDGEVHTLPVELDMELDRGVNNETIFIGSEGENVTIFMLAEQRGGIVTLDPELELFFGDGDLIGYSDDRMDLLNQGGGGPGVNGLDSRIDITLPADGEYRVVSGDLSDSSSGRYRLVIELGGPGGDGFAGGGGPGGFSGPMMEEEARMDEAVAVEVGPDLRPPQPEQSCGFQEPLEISLPFEGQVEADCNLAVLSFVIEDSALLNVFAVAYSGDPILRLIDDQGIERLEARDLGAAPGPIVLELEPAGYTIEVGNLDPESIVIDLLLELG